MKKLFLTILSALALVPASAQTALYSESFATSQGDFTIENVELGTLSYVWKWNSYNSDSYMKASAYNKTCIAADSYLVSPLFDATKASEMVLTFDHAVNKFGSDLAKEQVHSRCPRRGRRVAVGCHTDLRNQQRLEFRGFR